MQVDPEIAIPYAQSILRFERSMSTVLRSRLDFSKGRFEATADFYVETPDSWQITQVGYDANRVIADPETGETQIDFRSAVATCLLPHLATDRRVLLVEAAIAFPAPNVRARPESDPIRMYQLETEKGYEEYVALPGLEADERQIWQAIRFAELGWRDVGVVVEYDPKDLPPDGSWIHRELLEGLLETVVAGFFRIASYDGFLLWFRD